MIKSSALRFCSAATLALSLSQAVNAGEVIVISNPGITISVDEVKDIYLGEKQFAGSIKLVPVDNASVQLQFLPKFLQMNPANYNSAWSKKTFRDGLTQPQVKSSDAEVIEYVKRTPGAVGYVAGPSGVSIVK